MIFIGEEQGCAAIGQELVDLLGLERGIERDRDAAGSEDAEIGDDPLRAVGGEDGTARAALMLFNEILGDGFSAGTEYGVCPMLTLARLPLQFDGDAIGVLPGSGEEDVVEVRHGIAVIG